MTAVILLLAAGARAQSLQGQWHVAAPSHPAYSGVILIDADHRVTSDDKIGAAVARSVGYATVNPPKVEMLITAGDTVTRNVCRMMSPDRLECRSIQPDGRISVPIVMTRVGPGPTSLMPASR